MNKATNIIKDIWEKEEWKTKNEKYLKELQNFFDKADNIEDEKLKKMIIGQMLKCDETLTTISKNMFETCYLEGYNKNKE